MQSQLPAIGSAWQGKSILSVFIKLGKDRTAHLYPKIFQNPGSALSEKIQWEKVADHLNEISFADNNIAVVEFAGRKICLGKFEDKIFAFAFKCPHAGGFLSNGFIDALG